MLQLRECAPFENGSFYAQRRLVPGHECEGAGGLCSMDNVGCCGTPGRVEDPEAAAYEQLPAEEPLINSDGAHSCSRGSSAQGKGTTANEANSRMQHGEKGECACHPSHPPHHAIGHPTPTPTPLRFCCCAVALIALAALLALVALSEVVMALPVSWRISSSWFQQPEPYPRFLVVSARAPLFAGLAREGSHPCNA